MPDYVKPANGVQGHLIWTGKTYMFRVYSDTVGEFTDYNIRHSDLCVTITDEDAEFYKYSDGVVVLDHNRETLGL